MGAAAVPLMALGTGVGMFGMYYNMRQQINAARQNAQLIQQQAAMNAQFAQMTAGAQAVAIRNRAAFEGQMHEMNAGLMANNAMIAEQDAQSARERMRFEVGQIDSRNRRLMGAQRAAYAKAGVEIDSGTPQDVSYDSALAGEVEELAAIYLGRQEIRKNLVDAYQSRFSAEQQQFNADAVRRFGNDEASFAAWQGSTNAAIMLANGNMESASILRNIPTIRTQGFLNMAGAGLQGTSMIAGGMRNSIGTSGGGGYNSSGYPQPRAGVYGPAF
jgi:hypothetical protein